MRRDRELWTLVVALLLTFCVYVVVHDRSDGATLRHVERQVTVLEERLGVVP